MNRAAWIAVSAIVVVLGLVAGGLAAFLADDEAFVTTSAAPPAETRGFQLPLADDASVLTLAGHESDLLVGIAARRGGPVEIVALRGETPVPGDELDVTLDRRKVDSKSCGLGCSEVSASVLAGRATTLIVRHGAQAVSFDLPARLPPAGTGTFGRALRTMGSLRSYRFTERLSSGRATVFTRVDVQAPNRLRLRTQGFASVIIGETRWDRRNGRWERSSFPGLDVRDLLMWNEAKNPRVLRRERGRQELVAFGLKPVPAWFRLEVEPSGRVVEAEMTAASHFMLHRYSNFDEGVTIRAPR